MPEILKDGYDRRKDYREFRVRQWTRDELEQMVHSGQINRVSFHFIGLDGTMRDIRLNGMVKTWKRDPNRFEFSVKYGLREYGKWDMTEALDRLRCVIAVKEPGGEWKKV